MTLRQIMPLSFPDVTPAVVAGARPILRWVKPTDLCVDATYQRDLSRKSFQLIEQMYAGFAWSRMKPPVVVDAGGKPHVIDGQHTAIAAASLDLPEIPIFIVEAELLAKAIRMDGEAGFAKARAKASSERTPLWRALVARWARRLDQEAVSV